MGCYTAQQKVILDLLHCPEFLQSIKLIRKQNRGNNKWILYIKTVAVIGGIPPKIPLCTIHSNCIRRSLFFFCKTNFVFQIKKNIFDVHDNNRLLN